MTEKKVMKELTKDKNGIEIQTGDIVLFSGAYFKKHNGLFVVTNSPNDPGWNGDDYCCLKLGKRGNVYKYETINFIPLFYATPNFEKRMEAMKHDSKNLTIEIIKEFNRENVIKYFEKEVAKSMGQLEYLEKHVPDSYFVSVNKAKIQFLESVISRLTDLQWSCAKHAFPNTHK